MTTHKNVLDLRQGKKKVDTIGNSCNDFITRNYNLTAKEIMKLK
jgi:hypothetical protein